MSALDIEKELGTLTHYDHRGCLMEPDQTGDYLLISDVRDLLAKRAAQQPSGGDAERFALAIALEDNAEAMYAAVMSNAGDGAAIRAAFDADAIRITVPAHTGTSGGSDASASNSKSATAPASHTGANASN